MYSNGAPVAVVGDTTTGGGQILEGSDSFYIRGMPAAYVGAAVRCGQCGFTVIAEGSAHISSEGKDLALNGDRLACGHRIVVLKAPAVVSSRRDAGPPVPIHDRADRGGADIHTRSPVASVASTQQPAVGAYVFSLRIWRSDGRPHSPLVCNKQVADRSIHRGMVDEAGTSEPLHHHSATRVTVALGIPRIEVV